MLKFVYFDVCSSIIQKTTGRTWIKFGMKPTEAAYSLDLKIGYFLSSSKFLAPTGQRVKLRRDRNAQLFKN